MANAYTYNFDGNLPLNFASNIGSFQQLSHISGSFTVDYNTDYTTGAVIPFNISVDGAQLTNVDFRQFNNQNGIITYRVFAYTSSPADSVNRYVYLYYNGQEPTTFVNAEYDVNYTDYSVYPPVTNSATFQSQQLAVSETAACFILGTRIATARGEVPVERLAIGDTLVTADGETRPVTWIGRQSVVAAFADPLQAYPIRIAAGALSEDVPSRDLYLSPDHALFIDGVLVQAGALVNGTTVTRVMIPEARFTYYHVETQDHAIILAEGAPAETFVSNVTRRTFDNYAEYEALFGERADFEGMADRDEPRAMSARQVPARIRARLAARAAA